MINDQVNKTLDQIVDNIEDEWTSSNNFFDVNEINTAINGDIWIDILFGFLESQGLKKFIESRNAVMQDNLSDINHVCTFLLPEITAQNVVINEFMSDNEDDTQWNDPDGENEDWVELYNNTDNNIDLSNYFLSNDKSFYHKWEFPDNTIIEAKSFLIVWPDKDVDQNGLHTQYKLEKDKGDIILSYIDGSIIDQVTWTEKMEENTSLSRIPNGTGDFVDTDVTFNAENVSGISSTNVFSEWTTSIFPNPVEDILNIKLDATASLTSIGIVDFTGRTVLSTSTFDNALSINVSHLKPGIFYVNIKNNELRSFHKLVVK